jgi:hypothetical protein
VTRWRRTESPTGASCRSWKPIAMSRLNFVPANSSLNLKPLGEDMLSKLEIVHYVWRRFHTMMSLLPSAAVLTIPGVQRSSQRAPELVQTRSAEICSLRHGRKAWASSRFKVISDIFTELLGPYLCVFRLRVST